MGGVQFEEDSDLMLRRAQGVRPDNALVQSGIVKNITASNIILLAVGAALIVSAVYFLRASLAEPQTLGEDTPRRGEIIPSNRTL